LWNSSVLVRSFLYESEDEFRALYRKSGGSHNLERHILLAHGDDIDLDVWREELVSLSQTHYAGQVDQRFAQEIAEMKAGHPFVQLVATVYTRCSRPTRESLRDLGRPDWNGGGEEMMDFALAVARWDSAWLLRKLTVGQQNLGRMLFGVHLLTFMGCEDRGLQGAVLRLCDLLLGVEELRPLIPMYLGHPAVDPRVARRLFQRVYPCLRGQVSMEEKIVAEAEAEVVWEDTATIARVFPSEKDLRERIIEGDENGAEFVKRDLESRKDLVRCWAENEMDKLMGVASDGGLFEDQPGLLVALLDAALGADIGDVADILTEKMFAEIERTGDIPFARSGPVGH
jgi:hypothetical protein